jgi:predicted PhzF superfamily epimerase YddE/YHI9
VTDLPFFQVDAFTDRPFTGNPAAVMPLEAWLDDATLQAIAGENNLAETAFTVPATGDADYELRWFTPTIEVALCGHATLASGHILIGARETVRFRTRRSGVLSVSRDGDGYSMALPALTATPRALPEIAAGLGGAVVETLWHEGGYALVRYADEAAVRALAPDFSALKSMGNVLFVATAPGIATEIVSRAFAPGAGIDEDPVTGSAHAVLAPYWAGQLGRASFTAYQASRRGGHVSCRLDGDRAILGGRCVTVIEGRFSI